MFDVKAEILQAEQRIRPYIKKTPLDYSVQLSRATSVNVYLKCENLQTTGSFKPRGAFNKLLSLTPEQRQLGVVAASSGNHGAAVAYAMQKLKIEGKIFVPVNTAKTKLDNILNYTSALQLYATDCMQTEIYAREFSEQHGMVYVSPYNDPQVLAGQGTIGLELSTQLKHIDAIFVPIGGGGLIAGIAAMIKSISPQTRIVGCLPANSPVMAASIRAGHIVTMDALPTLSDATAGGIEEGAITFDLCQQYVDDYVLVSEAEIKAAMLEAIAAQHLLLEGASGVALGALLQQREFYRNKNVVVVLSGGNISLDTLREIVGLQ